MKLGPAADALVTRRNASSTSRHRGEQLPDSVVENAPVKLVPVHPSLISNHQNVLIFEFMEKVWYDADDNQLIGTVGNQGGLNACRFKWLVTVVTIEASSKQLALYRRLEGTVHWACLAEDFYRLERYLQCLKDKEGIEWVHIKHDESHIPVANKASEKDRPFFCVINEASPEWTKTMDKLYKEMALHEVVKVLGDDDKSYRGNNQKSNGYAQAAQTDRGTEGDGLYSVSRPKPMKNNESDTFTKRFKTAGKLTDHLIKRFPGVKLLVGKRTTNARDPQVQKEEVAMRQRLFADKILTGNTWYEASTLGINKTVDGEDQTLVLPGIHLDPNVTTTAHRDEGNDPRPGYDTQLVISGQFFCTPANESDNNEHEPRTPVQDKSCYRIFAAYYNKDCCGTFIERQRWQVPIVKAVKEHVMNNGVWRLSIQSGHHHIKDDMNKHFATHKGQQIKNTKGKVIDTLPVGVYQFPRLYTKSWLYGQVASCIRSLHERLPLTKYQAIEITFCMAFIKTPVMFQLVCDQWIADGKLPKGSLIAAFVKTAQEKSTSEKKSCASTKGLGGTFMSRPPFAQPVWLDVIEDALRCIKPRIEEWANTKYENATIQQKWEGMVKRVSDVLPNYGTLQAQHFLHVLVRIGLLPASLGNCASICVGTETYKRIRACISDSNNISIDEAEDILRDTTKRQSLLRAIAAELKVPLETAEHVLCKVLREKAKKPQQTHEVALEGHCVFIFEENKPNDVKMKRMDIATGKIDEKPCETMVWEEPTLKKKKQENHWWYKNERIQREKKHIVIKGSDSDSVQSAKSTPKYTPPKKKQKELDCDHGLDEEEEQSTKPRRRKDKIVIPRVAVDQKTVEKYLADDEKSSPDHKPVIKGQLCYADNVKVMKSSHLKTPIFPSPWRPSPSGRANICQPNNPAVTRADNYPSTRAKSLAKASINTRANSLTEAATTPGKGKITTRVKVKAKTTTRVKFKATVPRPTAKASTRGVKAGAGTNQVRNDSSKKRVNAATTGSAKGYPLRKKTRYSNVLTDVPDENPFDCPLACDEFEDRFHNFVMDSLFGSSTLQSFNGDKNIHHRGEFDDRLIIANRTDACRSDAPKPGSWDFAKILFHEALWKPKLSRDGKNHAMVMKHEDGTISFKASRTGRQMARNLLLLHYWMYPTVGKDLLPCAFPRDEKTTACKFGRDPFFLAFQEQGFCLVVRHCSSSTHLCVIHGRRQTRSGTKRAPHSPWYTVDCVDPI